LCCRDGMLWVESSRRSRFILFAEPELITIERITLGSALVFKDVRLRALQEAPTAFSSTYMKESAFLDDEWKKRAMRWSSGASAGFLAFDGDRGCGMVFSFAEELDPQRAQVVSMWVAPEVRREGVGKRLIETVLEWARGREMRDVKLMVTSVNHGAIAFYERLGFRMTGKTEVYPNDATIKQYEMVLALT
jgi:ribosomal protein S18 acetylase RimI-like enzyme